jgi:hypothetical protein
MLKKVKVWWSSILSTKFSLKKWIIISSIILILLILILFGTKLYLWANFLLGNDLVIKLDSNKASFFLKHGEEADLKFDLSVSTNPFCQAYCNLSFEDLSTSQLLDQQEAALRPGFPISKVYALKSTKLGKGQDLYRFNVKCRSLSTLLCHTGEEVTTRNILVVLSYDLNDEEKEQKEDLKGRYDQLSLQLASFSQLVSSSEPDVLLLDHFFYTDLLVLHQGLVASLNQSFSLLKPAPDYWSSYNYPLLRSLLDNPLFISLREQQQQFNLTLQVENQNLADIQNSLHSIESQMLIIKDFTHNDNSLAPSLSSSLADYNSVLSSLHQKSDFISKKQSVTQLQNFTSEIFDSIIIPAHKKSLFKEIEADFLADQLCQTSRICISHPSAKQRASESYSLGQACVYFSILNSTYYSNREYFQSQYKALNYSTSPEFQSYLQARIHNSRLTLLMKFIKDLPPNGTFTQDIKDHFPLSQSLPLSDVYSAWNLTPALYLELGSSLPPVCTPANFTLPTLEPINFTLPQNRSSLPVISLPELSDPEDQCCIRDQCRPCCTSQECQDDPSTYPILFLHGHAISKDISAEYSLEGFNQIQERLEDDGYLNAGAITLYTSRNTPYGEWGLSGVPVTLRGSYYYDIFETPENYIITQAKSENIDTYAIRLRELVETVKYKTGKPKVIIMTFSMGGLVARRYVQLFGADSVHKMILIGAPNKGIVGEVAEYCPLFGEEKECNDMNADSMFMKKLNSVPPPSSLPVYNIVGTGCVMDYGLGDGAVLEDRCTLKGATNFVIKGKCRSAVQPLHLDLRNLDLYPEVYDLIKKALKG